MEKVLRRAQRRGALEIVGPDALEILDAYGIPTAGYRIADSPSCAKKYAREIGYPVVMKIHTPEVLHKTEIGGVQVDLRSDEEIEKAYEKIHKGVSKLKSSQKSDEKFSVAIQPMVKGGVETVMGMIMDPTYGPLIMFGMGGVFVEVMKDVSFRVCPVSDVTAEGMVKSLRSYPLLAGFRGSKAVDMAGLTEGITRLSQLVNDFHQFAEIDINPFIALSKKGASRAVDARFLLQAQD